MEKLNNKIMAINSESDFEEMSLKLFHYQMENNPIYAPYATLILKGKIPSNIYYMIGFFTGILNILVGVIAPLLAVILRQSITEKKSIVGTLGYFGLIGNLLKIIGFTLIGFSFFEYIYTFIMIIPATLIGSRIGQIFLNRISNKIFTIIFQFILVGLAIKLLTS